MKSHILRYSVWGVGLALCLLWAATLASSQNLSSDDVHKQIAQKLEEFSRLQEATKSVEALDQTDGLGSGLSTKEAAQKVAALWTDINNIVSDIEKIQAQRNDNEESYNSILQQIKRVIIDIKTTKQTVIESVTKINLYTQNMIQTASDLAQTKEFLANTTDTLAKLLPALYMLQNEYTSQAGDIDDLKLILGSDFIGDTLSFDDMAQWLGMKLDSLLLQLSQAQERYTVGFKNMYETRKQLKKVTQTYHDKITTLQEQKAYLLDFLDLYKNNKIKLDQTIANIFETRTQLKSRIALLVNHIEQTRWNASISDFVWYNDFSQLKDGREQKWNFFLWPVLPVASFHALFGSDIKVWDMSETFDGIQIDAQQGQPIYAPANALVYYVQDQDGVWNNRIVLVHNNGFVTVFTNLSKVIVRSHDVVKRWQIIGLVGGQPGTRWAGWFSNSPMVTMQVFKNGLAVDPLQFLDLSALASQTSLPDTYQMKYKIDWKMRNTAIDLSTVTFVPGETIDDKRRNFLAQYAAAPYNDITMREQAVEWTNIDTDLGICIGYAETSLGRHFASANNIWNVGNNDRWDRVDKSSPIEGARAIYQTLNNQYLGWYHTIFELSGFGNNYGAIYASSEYNRQKNVSRCLSTIKWYIVPEDYPFRTYSEVNNLETSSK
jgi:murein DD-endopeptidase MepM/ murein hydrolase activator NlpD